MNGLPVFWLKWGVTMADGMDEFKGCIHHRYIICEGASDKCTTCGWNPVVEAYRKKLLRRDGRNALVSDKPKPAKPVREVFSPAYMRDYILKNFREFGGKKTQKEIMKELHISHSRFVKLYDEADEMRRNNVRGR